MTELVEIGSLDFSNKMSEQVLKQSAKFTSRSISQKCKKRDNDLRNKTKELAEKRKQKPK